MTVHNKGFWPYRVEVGDVLINDKGSLRVVREAKQDGDGFTTHVTFSIKHCSWTKRCITVLNYVDLKYQGYRPTGSKYSLTSVLDDLIQQNIKDYNKKSLTCCDVAGIN